MRWLFRTNFRSFYLLNATQFLGALNDNIFKLLVIYLLIAIKGPEQANIILSLAGAIFVIPFLLFSSAAGVLADRLSKRSIIVFAKGFELFIMISASIAVFAESEFGLYTCLFFLATHSALFGPSKYGIIPELVEEKMVSRANGSITSFTYLAMILGTFLASYLTNVTEKNFMLVVSFCTLISVIGLTTAFGITPTEPGHSTKKINPFFFYEIYQTLKISWNIPHLLPCIFGSSFFLFIGAFTQLNMIPFAMQSLGLSDVGGGFLFLPTAIGIAIGSILSGRIAKESVEPGVSCIAGVFISVFFVGISVFSHSLTAVICLLTLLGVAGGCYLIPFDAYLQVNAPNEKRGQIIAAANFFSFVGVLMAAIYLYFVSENLGFSAAHSFGLLGILCFFINLVLMGRLSALLFPFLAKKVFKKVRRLHLNSQLPEMTTVVILQSNSWLDAILLYNYFPELKILTPAKKLRNFPWLNCMFESIRIIAREPDEEETQEILEGIIQCHNENKPVCVFFHREGDPYIIDSFENILATHNLSHVRARLHKDKVDKKIFGIKFQQRNINIKM